MLKLNHSARLLDWRGVELEDNAEEGRENKKTGWKVEEENCSTEMEAGREKKKTSEAAWERARREKWARIEEMANSLVSAN